MCRLSGRWMKASMPKAETKNLTSTLLPVHTMLRMIAPLIGSLAASTDARYVDGSVNL
jgi:hypothetical protein